MTKKNLLHFSKLLNKKTKKKRYVKVFNAGKKKKKNIFPTVQRKFFSFFLLNIRYIALKSTFINED